MSFPVTIDAAVGGAEQPGKFATFLNGSARYQVQFSLIDPDTAQLVVYKSTDTGVTWSAVDASNGPSIVFDHLTDAWPAYSAVQVSATVLKVFLDDSIEGLAATGFTMGGSPAWSGTVTAVAPPPIGPNRIASEGNFPLSQIATAYRALDNKVVMVVVGDQVVLSDVPHSICSFVVYDVAGDSFGSWTDLGYLDYSDITTWDMVPCGVAIDASSGRSTVFMQQVARGGPGNLVRHTVTSDDILDIPLDAPSTANVQCWGPGGGSGGQSGVGRGGGGGGGEYRGGTVSITPGGTLTVTVGLGGAPDFNPGSGPTVVASISANPGQGGIAAAGGGDGGDGGTGGSGGSENNDGGKGGGIGSQTGGGGGGVGGPAAPGQDGFDGGSVSSLLGGAGGLAGDPTAPSGFGTCIGGAGGNVNDTNPPAYGQPAQGIGCGGGGQGGSSVTGNAGQGGDGLAIISWTSIRNTHGCRMFQQAIDSGDGVGTLTEITEGAYPTRGKDGAPVPLSFDCAALDGDVWMTFTGATSTSGRDDIAVGSGSTGNPVSFTFQTFSCGNGGNDIDSCPCLCLKTGVAYCCYISAPTAGPITFTSRADSGSGFASPGTIGTIAIPDIRQYGRLQASLLVSLPEVTFGTPTVATLSLVEAG